MQRSIHKVLRRLRHASVGEIRYRLNNAVDDYRQERLLARNQVCPESGDAFAVPLAALHLPEVTVEEEAGWGNAEREYVATLNVDRSLIQTYEKQQRKFYSRVQIKSNSPDIRAVWEPARLQHVSRLLLCANENSHRPIVHQQAKEALLDWIEANPLLTGPHYLSVMECGLRIPVFFYGLKLLTNLSQDDEQVLLHSMFEHAWWVSRRLSLYSSLGNHTVCEAVGLVFAGAVYEQCLQGKEWLANGIALLEQELDHQVLADGGPAEQSLNYHRFVLDLYWLTVDFLEKNQLADCSKWIPRLQGGEIFLSAFDDGAGGYPFIGDSDDGYAIAAGITPKRQLSAEVERNGDGVQLPVRSFSASGYTIVGSKKDMQIVFNHAPLGMAPLYNHGHADALSLTLTCNDQSVLIDPGTYRYNSVPQWRRYFKSTRAHNTVTIDGKDQAVQETGFIWSKPYTSKLTACKEVDGGVFMQASHDGYVRLKKPVVHTRSLLWLEKGTIVFMDEFSGKGSHDFEMNLHLHPGVSVIADDTGWVVLVNGAELFIATITIASISRGLHDPLLGWYSEAYGRKEPCSVLSCREEGKPADVQFITVISDTKIGNIQPLKERMHKSGQTINS